MQHRAITRDNSDRDVAAKIVSEAATEPLAWELIALVLRPLGRGIVVAAEVTFAMFAAVVEAALS